MGDFAAGELLSRGHLPELVWGKPPTFWGFNSEKGSLSSMSVVRKLRRAFKRDGFWKTVILCARNLREKERNEPQSQFDIAYGLHTDGRVDLGDLRITAPSDIWGFAYVPTPASIFANILSLLPPPEGYSFVDLGSGKGRVVLMAAQQPFESVTGVEFSSELCSIAESNLACFRPHIAARDVRIVCEDAALFEFPPGPLIVYFYQAFEKEVLSRVVERLSIRRDETIFVYFNPQNAALFAGYEAIHSEEAVRIWRLTSPRGQLSGAAAQRPLVQRSAAS